MSKEIYYERGFKGIKFKDLSNNEYYIQEACEDDENQKRLIFGINIREIKNNNDAKNTTEDFNHELQNDTSLSNKIILSQDQVKELLPYLQIFIDHGNLSVIKKKSKRKRHIISGTATSNDSYTRYAYEGSIIDLLRSERK